jgi:hypothetical protein
MTSLALRVGLAVVAAHLWVVGVALADSPRVAILPALTLDASSKSTLEADARAALVKAVGAQADGVLLTKLSRDKLACDEPQCLRQLADGVRATHLLRVQASYRRESYKLKAELWNTQEGRIIETQQRQCEVCSPGDLITEMREVATALCARLTAEPPAPQPAPPPAPAVVPQPVPAAALQPAPPPAPVSHRSRTWPWVTMGAGAAVLATGITLWAVDPIGDCPKGPDSCLDGAKRTKGWGIGLTAAGAAALIGGGAWLLLDSDEGAGKTALLVSPEGVSVKGSF